jgi:thiamine pyrophosphate-dependent acetolactate synthase large subunit-like protein
MVRLNMRSNARSNTRSNARSNAQSNTHTHRTHTYKSHTRAYGRNHTRGSRGIRGSNFTLKLSSCAVAIMMGEVPMTSFALASTDVNVNNITATEEQKNQCHNVSTVMMSPRAKQQAKQQPKRQAKQQAKQQPKRQAKQQPKQQPKRQAKQPKQQPHQHEIQLILNRDFIIMDTVGFNRPQLRVVPSMKTNMRYIATKPSPPTFGGWRINETKDFIIVDAVGINTVASA